LTPASSTATALWRPVLAGAPRNHAGLEGLEVRGEKLGEEKRGADTLTVNLSLRILANFEVREAGHVAGCSRPSDRPGGRPRSCFPLSFCKKKTSNLREINPRSKFLSQKILQKSPQLFSKSTRSPTILVEGNLQIKP